MRFGRWLFRGIRGLIEWFDAHNALVTAVATVVIAWYAVLQEQILSRQVAGDELAQRASIFLGQLSIIKAVGDHGEPKALVNPIIENSGETPTVGMQYITFCQQDGMTTFDYTTRPTLHKFLGPKQSDGTGRCEITIPQNPPKATGPVANLYIGGKLAYFDVFDRNRAHVHILEYCESVPVIQVFDAQSNTLEFRVGMDGPTLCEEHNCADEECPAADRASP